ncbi:hypothetical protein BJX62DRAFT_236546 [Aspergillus germanicus]
MPKKARKAGKANTCGPVKKRASPRAKAKKRKAEDDLDNPRTAQGVKAPPAAATNKEIEVSNSPTESPSDSGTSPEVQTPPGEATIE